MYKFYVKMENAESGPYSAKEIKELDLLEDILVRQESEMEWHEAKKYNFISLANDEFVESLYESHQISESANNNKLNVTFRNEMLNERVDSTRSCNTNIPPSDGLIACPECGIPSDSIKCFTLPHYAVFLGVYAQWQTKQYVCCPKCMRKHIAYKCFTYNIIAANLLWPVFILPCGITQLIRSSQKGHTKTVRELYNITYGGKQI